jgi:hypothetical protein
VAVVNGGGDGEVLVLQEERCKRQQRLPYLEPNGRRVVEETADRRTPSAFGCHAEFGSGVGARHRCLAQHFLDDVARIDVSDACCRAHDDPMGQHWHGQSLDVIRQDIVAAF